MYIDVKENGVDDKEKHLMLSLLLLLIVVVVSIFTRSASRLRVTLLKTLGLLLVLLL